MMDYLALLESGIEKWNQWRSENPDELCDLSHQDLSEGFYVKGNFSDVNFASAQLQRACFIGANLRGADLSETDLTGAYMGETDLREANLSNANLTDANLNRADLRGANLAGVDITWAHTYKAEFSAEDARRFAENALANSRVEELDDGEELDNKVAQKETIDKETIDKETIDKETADQVDGAQINIAVPVAVTDTALKTGENAAPTMVMSDRAGLSSAERVETEGKAEAGRVEAEEKAAANWVVPTVAISVVVMLLVLLGNVLFGSAQVFSKNNARSPKPQDVLLADEDAAADPEVRPVSAPIDPVSFELAASIDSDSEVSTLATYASPEGDMVVVSGSTSGNITAWNQQTGEQIRVLEAHGGPVHTLAVSESGRWLISGSYDGVKVWHLDTGERIYEIESEGPAIESVAISSSGRIFLSADERGKITVWHVESGEALYSVNSGAAVWALAIAPDGQSFVSGNSDGIIHHRDLVSGKAIRTLHGHDNAVQSLAISADSRSMVSGSWDSTIKLWDLQSGELKATLTGHQGRVTSVAISPDGKLLASGGTDNLLKRWDVPSRQLVETIETHSDWILAVAFTRLRSPRFKDTVADVPHDQRLEHMIISGGKDQKINMWQPPTDKIQS